MAEDAERLTEEDYNSLYYFYEYKGDITAWHDWEKKKPLFKEHHPHLVDAMERLDIAERTLKAVVHSLPYG